MQKEISLRALADATAFTSTIPNNGGDAGLANLETAQLIVSSPKLLEQFKKDTELSKKALVGAVAWLKDIRNVKSAETAAAKVRPYHNAPPQPSFTKPTLGHLHFRQKLKSSLTLLICIPSPQNIKKFVNTTFTNANKLEPTPLTRHSTMKIANFENLGYFLKKNKTTVTFLTFTPTFLLLPLLFNTFTPTF